MEPLVKSIFSEVKNNLNMNNARLETGKLYSFEADYPLIKQVVANLISNALKFSAGAAVPTVHVESKIENDNVVYTFSDNGIGFDDNIKDKIFGIFYRSSQAKDYKGTGIGLAIVKKIIDKHGGKITAQGTPGKGAAFTFTLPVKSKIKI
jgi:signal transduction histidine kinase